MQQSEFPALRSIDTTATTGPAAQATQCCLTACKPIIRDVEDAIEREADSYEVEQ